MYLLGKRTTVCTCEIRLRSFTLVRVTQEYAHHPLLPHGEEDNRLREKSLQSSAFSVFNNNQRLVEYYLSVLDHSLPYEVCLEKLKYVRGGELRYAYFRTHIIQKALPVLNLTLICHISATLSLPVAWVSWTNWLGEILPWSTAIDLSQLWGSNFHLWEFFVARCY